MAAALPDELAEEILLRFPPDDPARLVRAALVCKLARGLVADPGFRRRYLEFHGAPPLLGFFRNARSVVSAATRRGARRFVFDGGERDDLEGHEQRSTVARFVPTTTSSSCLSRAADLRGWRVIDARHGRVLLHSKTKTPCGNNGLFAVRDPVTDDWRFLPDAPVSLDPNCWNAAVLRAAAAGCSHLHCRRGPFSVVLVAITPTNKRDFIYSSEDALWHWPPIPWVRRPDDRLDLEPSALVGDDALYFVFHRNSTKIILEYNVGTREMYLIRLPPGCFSEHRIVLMSAEDGGLGFATVCGSILYLWSRKIGSDGGEGWARRRIYLFMLLPLGSLLTSVDVAGFANGISVIFLRTSAGLVMIDLKSSRVEGVSKVTGRSSIFPYMSFYDPALGSAAAATNTGEELSTAASSPSKA